jgi:hypothetical protein
MLEHGKPLEEGTKPPAGAGTEGEDDSPGTDSKPKKFNDLAESLGIELAELYKLEIATSADGKPVTVEMLKDHHSKRSDFTVAQVKWEEEKTRQQADLVRGNTELRELIAAIPRDKLDPKVLEAVRGKVEESGKRERARTLEVIAEWRDAETMTKDLTGMGEWLKGYGFPADYLKTVVDHRALLMMRDAWKRDLRIKAALEEIERESPTATGKGKPTGKAPSKPSSGPKARGRVGLEALLE